VNWVGAPINQAIGWDVLQPQSGFNVRAWTPTTPNGSQVANNRDDFGQPLRHDNYSIKIPVALPENVSVGDKMRAHIRVHESEAGKVSQRPSAQPIALNDDGAARSPVADPKVLVYRYQVQNDIDFSGFGLRLT
jgi:hypothetical protein